MRLAGHCETADEWIRFMVGWQQQFGGCHHDIDKPNWLVVPSGNVQRPLLDAFCLNTGLTPSTLLRADHRLLSRRPPHGNRGPLAAVHVQP